MSTAEVKSLIHKLVVETDDLDVLEQVVNFFKVIKTKHSDWWDTISEEQKTLIQKGIEQMKQGERISHKEARKEIDNILKQKQA